MPVEIRPAAPEDMDEFRQVASTALLLTEAQVEGFRAEWSRCAFVDGELATTYGAWPLRMQLDGRVAPVAGVTFVGTRPAHRRRGLLRAVTADHFRALHEEAGPALAALHASRAAIYQRYGYAVVAVDHAYAVDPRDLRLLDPRPRGGRVVEVGDDDVEALAAVHRAFVADRTGPLVRRPFTWRAVALAPPPPGGARWQLGYEEDGELRGYAVVAAERGDGDGQRVVVRDLAWLDAAAYRALWAGLAAFDLADVVAWPRAPEDDPLPHLLEEPRRLRRTARDGILARVVDVRRAPACRGWREEARLVVEVVDDLCPWNAGRWALDVGPGGAEVRPAQREPDLTLPAATLALLLFGQVDATAAARMGRLDVHRHDALPTWDRVLRTAHRPHCPDPF